MSRGWGGPIAAPLMILALLAAGCSAGSPGRPPTPSAARSISITPSPKPSPAVTPRQTPRATSKPRAEFEVDQALRTIRYLADEVGPREASSQAYERAADYLRQELIKLGYDVTTEPVPVPAGNSWGVAVPRGESANVVAQGPGFDRTRPYVVIGAHLDTVPQAPGAEDNASGVSVLLELARLLAIEQPRQQVRLIAFGAEEPRGTGDSLHHFGSRRHIATLSPAERDRIQAMVSLDRVGVRGATVPVCQSGTSRTRLVGQLMAAAPTVPTSGCQNRSSDHWSFTKAGIPAARIGSIPYAAYHSADDVPSVIDRRQLDRVGRLVWAWLTQR